jgi:hypothetical protein
MYRSINKSAQQGILLAVLVVSLIATQDSVAADDLAQRSARSPEEVAEALAKNYGHSMGQVSYIPALALWGRLRLAELKGGDDEQAVIADVKSIAAASPVPTKWSSGSVIAGHLIYGAIDDRDRLLSAAAWGLDDAGRARDYFPGHSDMSDAVFMHSPVLATAYRMSGDAVYLEACLAHYAFMKKLCRRDDGIYRHSPLDEAAWGRGNGFPALGIALVLSELKVADAKVVAEFKGDLLAHLRALKKHQDADGMWHQVIDHPESYAEFSCTCMIGFAMLRGMREGWLDRREFEESADRAWSAIKKRIHLDGKFLEGVCTGTGKQTSLQAYFDRKEIHGRDNRGGAMALMFSTERMMWENAKP